MAKKNDLKVQDEKKALSTNVLDFAADAGAGMEEVDKDSFSIPFIQVLQGLSDAVTSGEVEGARAGLLMNTVNKKVVAEALLVPVMFQRRYLLWADTGDRSSSFRGQVTVDDYNAMVTSGEIKEESRSDQKGKERKVMIKDGVTYNDTRIHYVMVVNEDGSFYPAVVSMSRTGIRKSKDWMALMNEHKVALPDGKVATAPTFARAYRMGTMKKQNDDGTWFVPTFKTERDLGNEDFALYNACKEFRSQVMQGAVDLKPPVEDEGDGEGVDGKKF